MKRIALTATALAALALTSAAQAEPFTLLIYETPAELALRRDPGPAGQAYWAEYARFGETLQASGALRGGAALQPGETSRPERGLQLGGYFVVDAADKAAAAAMAANAPATKRGGAVEVRAQVPSPAMRP